MKEGKLVFDPRPKLLLLFTMGVFVLGNAGGDLFNRYTPLFCIVPMILFVLDGKWKTGVWYLILYAVAYELINKCCTYEMNFSQGRAFLYKMKGNDSLLNGFQ